MDSDGTPTVRQKTFICFCWANINHLQWAASQCWEAARRKSIRGQSSILFHRGANASIQALAEKRCRRDSSERGCQRTNVDPKMKAAQNCHFCGSCVTAWYHCSQSLTVASFLQYGTQWARRGVCLDSPWNILGTKGEMHHFDLLTFRLRYLILNGNKWRFRAVPKPQLWTLIPGAWQMGLLCFSWAHSEMPTVHTCTSGWCYDEKQNKKKNPIWQESGKLSWLRGKCRYGCFQSPETSRTQ